MNAPRALLFSVIFHLVLLLALRLVPERWAWESTPLVSSAAEIEIIERPAKKNEPQFVREAIAPKIQQDDSSDEEARFTSAQRQRVLNETRARITGLTRNGSARALPKDSWMRKWAQRSNEQKSQEEQQQQARRERSPDGYEPIQIPKPSQHQNSGTSGFDDAPSTIGELLPDDVSVGEFTALNTDRFKYYSFYSRVEELVRFRWERGLQQAMEAFSRDYLTNIIGRRSWVTRVEFLLTPEGRYHSALIHKESGVRRFDGAAVAAFRDAAVFPNPPRELVKEDGLIHIEYSFNVHTNPGVLSGR